MPLGLRRHLAGVATVAAGLALVGAYAGCGANEGDNGPSAPTEIDSSARRPIPPVSPQEVAVIRRVGANERKHFALLRGQPEPLPLYVRRILRRPNFGVNWDLAHRLPLSLRRSFWLVPGRRFLCVVYTQTIHEVADACAPTKVALEHGIVAASLRDPGTIGPAQRLIVGVVPDGASEAVVHTGKVASKVSIARHLFVLKDSLGRPPDVVSLSWSRGKGP